MFCVFFAILQVLFGPSRVGLFETRELYLVKVTSVQAPNHPKLLGKTTLRIDEVLIGPMKIKGTVATYNFFTPISEMSFTGGNRYSGRFPDFAFPAPKGQARFWWATPSRDDGWKTADFQKVGKFVPRSASELLLKADLKPGSVEFIQQAELVDTLVQLESKRTLIEQLAMARELQHSKNKHVSTVGERTLKGLSTPSKPKKKKSITPHNRSRP